MNWTHKLFTPSLGDIFLHSINSHCDKIANWIHWLNIWLIFDITLWIVVLITSLVCSHMIFLELFAEEEKSNTFSIFFLMEIMLNETLNWILSPLCDYLRTFPQYQLLQRVGWSITQSEFRRPKWLSQNLSIISAGTFTWVSESTWFSQGREQKYYIIFTVVQITLIINFWFGSSWRDG